MKDLESQTCLELEIVRNKEKRKLLLHQESYASKILDRFQMSCSRSESASMQEARGIVARLEYLSEVSANVSPYREAIESRTYLIISTRLDIVYAVEKLFQFCESALDHHCNAIKHLLRYVVSALKFGINCSENLVSGLGWYCGAGCGGNNNTRKTTSEIIFLLAKGAVSWCSKNRFAQLYQTLKLNMLQCAPNAKLVRDWRGYFVAHIWWRLVILSKW